MEFHLPHFSHKEAPKPTEQVAEQAPLTEEGITQSEVDKSEAFVAPLASEAATKEMGGVVINAEKAVDTETVASDAQPASNVVELPTPEAKVVEAPQEPADTDQQIPAQTA